MARIRQDALRVALADPSDHDSCDVHALALWSEQSLDGDERHVMRELAERWSL